MGSRGERRKVSKKRRAFCCSAAASAAVQNTLLITSPWLGKEIFEGEKLHHPGLTPLMACLTLIELDTSRIFRA